MKPIYLDLRTLSVVLMLMTAFMSVTMFFIWRVHRTYAGFGLWTLANLLAAVGFFFLSLRGVMPDFITVIVGNCLAVGCNLLCLEGNRKFLGLANSKWFSVALFGIYAATMIYFTYADESVVSRIFVSSACLAIISACNWFVFTRIVHRKINFTYKFARVTYIAFTVLMILRIVFTGLFSDIKDFYAPDVVQPIFYTVFIIFSMIWTFQYMILNNERLQYELQTAQVELEKLATTDFLTGFNNKRCFFEIGKKEIGRAQRLGHSLSVIMFDIDFFKHINDTHGHAAGDLVLTEIAAICRTTLRGIDVLGRVGGEEFAMLLPHTDAADAITVAERLRSMIEQSEIEFLSGKIHVTASFGVSELLGADEEIEAVLERADALLYEAKHRGRNLVISEFAVVSVRESVTA